MRTTTLRRLITDLYTVSVRGMRDHCVMYAVRISSEQRLNFSIPYGRQEETLEMMSGKNFSSSYFQKSKGGGSVIQQIKKVWPYLVYVYFHTPGRANVFISVNSHCDIQGT